MAIRLNSGRKRVKKIRRVGYFLIICSLKAYKITYQYALTNLTTMEAALVIFDGKNLIVYFSLFFAMLLIVITYFLMKAELRKETPRKMALQTIWVFMVLTLVTTLVTGIYAVSIANKNIELQVKSIKSDRKIEDLMIQISELTDMVKSANTGTSLAERSPGRQTEVNFGYLEENGRLWHHYTVLQLREGPK